MKKLNEFLKKNDANKLACDLGVTPSSLYYWRTGRSYPSVLKALKLEKVTKGAVKVHDWK